MRRCSVPLSLVAAEGISRFTELPVRQREVLLLLWQGATNKVMAQRLDLAESTVNVHVRTLMKKLGARNRTQVVIRSSLLLGLDPDALTRRP